MAKARKIATAQRPVLAAALFCEQILDEKDDVLTAVRIVDTLTVAPPPLPPPVPGQPARKLVTQIRALIAFKSQGAAGDSQVEISSLSPTGKRRKAQTLPVKFLGAGHGVTIRADVMVEIEEEGWHWYEVRLDGNLFTRMPLRVIHEKPPTGVEPSAPAATANGKG